MRVINGDLQVSMGPQIRVLEMIQGVYLKNIRRLQNLPWLVCGD